MNRSPESSRRPPPTAPLLALGVAAAVALLVLPVPSPLLDVLLTAQLAAAAIALWVAATARRPAELGAFPMVLLALTLGRLALNVATTRAILSRGEAGAVVEAFGDVVVGGDLFVGLAVFAVITLAQYIVVARGAGRVAEVSARFALDAMPGRQQAIEAEVRAGLLDADGARKRREALGRLSGLYGAMDGVMRFVRGDALAGLCIVAVNIVGGLWIGVERRGLDVDSALSTYTVLTIGDGLASQVPAVLVTAAAAVLATRLASPGDGAARPLSPDPLWGAAILFALLALAPGLPGWPMAAVAVGLAIGAGRLRRGGEGLPAAADSHDAPSGPALTVVMHPQALDALGGDITRAVRSARQRLAEDGVALPDPRLVPGATDEPPGGYRIEIAGAPVARGTLVTGRIFVCPLPRDGLGLPGRHPEHDAPGRWIERGAGLDPAAFFAIHLAAAWRRSPWAIGVQTVADRIGRLEIHQPALVRAVVPVRVDLPELAALLRDLLAEDVPIGDLPALLEALAAQPTQMPRAARLGALRRTVRPWLTHRRTTAGWLAIMCAGRALESALRAGMVGPATAEALIEQLDTLRARHPRAVLVVSDDVRVAARALLETRPGLPILGHGELGPEVHTRVVGLVDAEM